MTVCEQEEFIINNMPLVKTIASKYHNSKVGIEYEDLVSYGVMGLLDAIDKFDENRGAKFSTYASIRISSFIIDEIRKQSPVSRMNVSKIKEYNKSIDILQNKLSREPSLDEVSKYMGVSKKDIDDIKKNVSSLNIKSLDNVVFDNQKEMKLVDTIEDKNELSPSSVVEKKELKEIMAKAIDTLKEKDKLILSLYYYEELTLKEIGLILGVSESRISQINKKAISRLKEAMRNLKYLD